MDTQRFSDPETLTHYPLPVVGAVDWLQRPSTWETEIPLTDLARDWILAPSLSLLGPADYKFRFTLLSDHGACPLPFVPRQRVPRQSDAGCTSSTGSSTESAAENNGVHPAIDCFHTLKKLTNVRLKVECVTESRPEHYLLTISARPTEIEVSDTPVQPAAVLPRPPAHSQMLENPRIANRICSPISTAMVLAGHRPCIDYGQITRACYDPVTRMYGMWPLAIRAASRQGVVGAVELISTWETVRTCLARNLPVVASIRFPAGELPGAPLTATGGHLVVVHGIEGDDVLVNDPAAPNHGSVNRRYSLNAFSRAWFRYRGAAYILAP